jgi:hypothetical protein
MAKNQGRKQQVPKPPSPRELFLKKVQKVVIWTLVISIPLTLFVIIPIACRNHFVKTLKISEDVFLSAPEHINLVNTEDVGPCYRIKINGYTFAIPEKFTPSKIDFNEAEFRMKSRAEGRYIYLHSEHRTRTMNFNSNGITKWFLPTETRKFLPIILNANWHPFRLMFKAQFFASEGITSKIFQSKWDKNHIGYIFPSPGNEGYLGRIFRMNDSGTVEFLISDSVKPVTLREWVNIAMMIQTPAPGDYEELDEDNEKNLFSLDDLIMKASDEEQQASTLNIALNEFYRVKEPEWLIPVAIVMQERGFFPDVLDLIEQYKTSFAENSKYQAKWNELVDKAVAESITIEADPLLDVRELNLYCKNLTDMDINQISLTINITSNLGLTKSFDVSLLKQSSLRSREEKQIQVKCPADISLSDAVHITHRVTSLGFAK